MQRWGLTLPLPSLPLRDHAELVRGAEAAGYTDLWSGETQGPDGFTPARARRGLDRAGPPRHRRRRRLHPRARRCWPSRRRRSPTRATGASRSGSAPRRTGSSRAGTRCRSRSRCRRSPRRSTSSTPRSRASAPRPASSSSRRPPSRSPIVLAALRGKMLRLAVERAAGAFTNFLPLAGLPRVTAELERAPRGLRAPLPLLLPPRASASRSSRWRGSCSPPTSTVPVYEAFFRWLGYGERIDEMVRGLEGQGSRGRRRRGAVGRDRGHVRLRDARRDAGAPRRIRRRGDHAADPDPDHARRTGWRS